MIARSPLIEELRKLPTDRLEETAAFIDALVAERHARRNAMIEATGGSLGEAESNALETALAECERVDENAW